MALDMDKLNVFVGQFVGDLGAAVHSGMVVIGEKLGLYKALAEGPLNSAELAAKTRTDERYVREWLCSQAAGGYVTYNEQTRKFSLSEEQAFTLANEESPAYLPGAFQLALGSLAAVPRITEAFRSGAGEDDAVYAANVPVLLLVFIERRGVILAHWQHRWACPAVVFQ